MDGLCSATLTERPQGPGLPQQPKEARAGGKIVTVGVLEDGNVDIEAIRKAAEKHKDNLAALMITYPSTHGVYESGVDTTYRTAPGPRAAGTAA